MSFRCLLRGLLGSSEIFLSQYTGFNYGDRSTLAHIIFVFIATWKPVGSGESTSITEPFVTPHAVIILISFIMIHSFLILYWFLQLVRG